MKYECNIFKDVWDRDCSNVVNIMTVLKGITNGHWKDQVLAVRQAKSEGDKDKLKELKFRLPAVTWSGIFEERVDDACVSYNNLMVVDIDDITDLRLRRLKAELKSNPWVFAFFDGPSKGIKLLVFIDSELDWHSKHAFQYIEKLFDELYGIKIDASGKNPSRLCFVSYDPELYINPKPEVLHIEEQHSLHQFQKLNNHDYSNSQISTDASHIMDVAVKMVNASKAGTYHKGNRNNFIFVLSCLMCEFGVNPEQTFSLIVDRYKSLPHKEINAAVNSAYKRSMSNFGTKTVNQRRKANQNNLL